MAGVQRLSTPEIMRVSRDVLNKLSSQHQIELSTVHKFLVSARYNLSDSEIKDVELAVLLMASAHEASNNHFDNTKRLLNLCSFLSSYNGNAVQRVVHHFTKALHQRIARETGMIPSESEEKKLLCPDEQTETTLDPDYVSCWLQIPLVRITHLAAIQAVTESLASAKKVHFVAFSIRSGVFCPVLMQALANQHECPVELLKITAVGISESKQNIEQVGKCLSCLAENLSLPFEFCSVRIADIEEFGKEMFEISEDEAVAVISFHTLRKIRVLPCWKSFPRFLMDLKPCVLVIVEPEVNYDLVVFVDRFYEALLCFGSFFDCIGAFVDKGDRNRVSLEAFLGQEIEHILTAKDEEIFYWNSKIGLWREYFTVFGMVETEVSFLCFNQAKLLLKKSGFEEFCLLERIGKCLMTGWQGTPFFSVSAWKFPPEKSKAGLYSL